MTQAWPIRTLESLWSQGLDQGWPCDLSWANENDSSFLRGWWNLAAKNGHVTQAWPMSTLNHCGHRIGFKDWHVTYNQPMKTLPTFAGKECALRRGALFPTGFLSWQNVGLAVGAILPPQGNRIPNNEAQRRGKQGARMETEIPEDIICMSDPAMPEAAYPLDLSATSANKVFFWPKSIWVKILRTAS